MPTNTGSLHSEGPLLGDHVFALIHGYSYPLSQWLIRTYRAQVAVRASDAPLTQLCLRCLLHVPFTDTLIATFNRQPVPHLDGVSLGACCETVAGLVGAVATGAVKCGADEQVAAADVLEAWARRVPSVQEEAAGTKGPKGKGKKQIVSKGGATRDGGVVAAPFVPRVFNNTGRRVSMPEPVALGAPVDTGANPVLKTVRCCLAAAQMCHFQTQRRLCEMLASVSVGRFR
jgi:hypothetical protein